MTNQQTLAHLIGRTALKDRGAFQSLYEATSSQVFGLLNGMLNRRDLAEEVLQDTYLKVWQNASEYHCARGQVTTWISSIARYRALDILRAKKDVTRADDFDVTVLIDESNVGDEAVLSQDSSRLARCFERLNQAQKQSISLAFFRGLTHDEAAVSLHVPLGTVKSSIRRGISSLQECMQ